MADGKEGKKAEISGTVLTAKQLFDLYTAGVHQRRRQADDVTISGEKLVDPTGSKEEEKQLERRLSSLEESVSAPRISSRNHLAEAEWIADVGKAKVTKPHGKFWEAMGHVPLGCAETHLFPEETLFLMECNNLQVTMDRVPMSLQRAYMLMLGPDCPSNSYTVYSNLSRLGFKLLRHKNPNVQDPQEIAMFAKEVILEMIDVALALSISKVDQNVSQEDVLEIFPKKEEFPVENGSDTDEVVILSKEESSRISAFSMIPNCYKRRKIMLTTPPLELLPFRSWPEKKTYKLTIPFENRGERRPAINYEHDSDEDVEMILEKVAKRKTDEDEVEVIGEMAAKRARRDLSEEPALSQSFNRQGFESYLSAERSRRSETPKTNGRSYYEKYVFKGTPRKPSNEWARLKSPIPVLVPDDEEVMVIEEEAGPEQIADCLKNGELSVLWSGKSQPLIRPSQATSTKRILKRLGLGQQRKDVGSVESRFKIQYDMYLPQTRFKKSDPCPPNFRIAISDTEDGNIPSIKDILSITGAGSDHIPVLFAFCSDGSVSYYCFSSIDLQNMTTVG